MDRAGLSTLDLIFMAYSGFETKAKCLSTNLSIFVGELHKHRNEILAPNNKNKTFLLNMKELCNLSAALLQTPTTKDGVSSSELEISLMTQIRKMWMWCEKLDENSGLHTYTYLFVTCFGYNKEVFGSAIEGICDNPTISTLVVDWLLSPDTTIIPTNCLAAVNTTLKKLSQQSANPWLYNHPIVGRACRIANGAIKAKNIAKKIEEMIGIPESSVIWRAVYMAYMQLYPDNNGVIDDLEGKGSNSQIFANFLKGHPESQMRCYNLAMFVTKSGFVDGVEWLLSHDLIKANGPRFAFFRDVLTQVKSRHEMEDVAQVFCLEGVELDEHDEKNLRIIHYFIEYIDENVALSFVKFFVERSQMKIRNPTDAIDVLAHAKAHRRYKVLTFLKSHLQILDEYHKLNKDFFIKRYGATNVKFTYMSAMRDPMVKELGIKNCKNGDIVVLTVCICNDCLQNGGINRPTLVSILEQNNVKYNAKICAKNIFVNYVQLKAMVNNLKKSKTRSGLSKQPQSEPVAEVIEPANIVAGGGSGGKRPKSPPKRNDIDPKFSTIERDAVYNRLHVETSKRLHESCSIGRQFDEPQIPKLTLAQFKLHAEHVLGSQYSDEIANYFFTMSRYDPKTASPAEKSICGSLCAEFKHRNDTSGTTVQELPDDTVLIEVRPRRNSNEKTSTRKICVHLKAAAHEFLFLKGVFSWFKSIEKPEEVYEHIFEDCMRLSATRFYNSMLLFHREGNTSVSINDAECGHLRNVLVHNLEIPRLKEHVLSVLFPFGEQVLSLVKGKKSITSVIVLRDCELYTTKVQDDSTIEGHVCRSHITKLLFKLKTYSAQIAAKIDCNASSHLLNSLNRNWNKIGDDLKIWIHHARAIEFCILHIGQLSRSNPKFLNKEVQNYVMLCKEVRHIGYHQNGTDENWNFDPINPSFLADMMRGVPKI